MSPAPSVQARLAVAKAVSVLSAGGLLAAAFAFQYWGGLYPCEMCWWQRYAHIAALAFVGLALLTGGGRPLVVLAAVGGRAERSDRLLSRRSRARLVRGPHPLHLDGERRLRRRHTEIDHGRADGPLRRRPMVVARNRDGGVECYPFAGSRVGHPMAEPQEAASRVSGWRPGDPRPDVPSMLRVDQAGEYGASRIY